MNEPEYAHHRLRTAGFMYSSDRLIHLIDQMSVECSNPGVLRSAGRWQDKLRTSVVLQAWEAEEWFAAHERAVQAEDALKRKVMRGERSAPPGTHQIREEYFQRQLHQQMGGKREASLKFGRADLLTTDAVWEVEPFGRWHHGVRQVLAYAAQCNLKPMIALYGPASRNEVLKTYLTLRESPGVKVGLWWWYGRWVPVTSRKSCKEVHISWYEGLS